MLFFRNLLIIALLLHGNGVGSGPPAFTSAWKTIQTSGGGAAVVMHVYGNPASGGLALATGDTFGAWLYHPTGTCTRDATVYSAPCWSVITTTDSLPAGDVNWTNASSGNTTCVDVVAAPSNLNVLYAWCINKVYVSINQGASWTWTGLTVSYQPNGGAGDKNHDWMAVDPANPDIVYLVTPSGTFGPAGASSGTLLVNTTGRTCTTNCWTAVAGIPAPLTHKGGNVVFDPTSSVVGGVTQGIYVNIQGSTGVWHTTNASTFAQVNTGTPPSFIIDLICDKFGEVWGVEGFYGTGNRINKLASGTWTQTTISTSGTLVIIQQDPNTGALVANNQLIVIDTNGQVTVTFNNGTDGWQNVGTPTLNTIPQSALSLSATGQAGWLGIVNQYSGGLVALSPNAGRFDPTGKLWIGTGIDMVTAPDPIVTGALSASLTYSFNTIGADQLVNNQIIVPIGLGPSNVNWDRGVFINQNPDIFATSQYANKNNNCTSCPPVVGGWSVDYAPAAPGTQIAGLAGQGGGSAFAVTTDGGHTVTQLGTVPAVGIGLGAQVAASTTTNWCVIPGDGAGQNTIISCTSNAGTNWATATITGTPAAFISGNIVFSNGVVRYPLTADRVTAGKFYAIDLNQKVFSSTDGGANFAPTGASLVGSGVVQSDRLIAVPGQAGNVFYVAESGPVKKSTDSGVTFASICTGSPLLDNVHAFGFGAAKPGGSGYPAIYMFQAGGGTAPVGYYASFDGGTTCAALNVPASEQVWASHVLDFPASLTGDMDIYGRLLVGVIGSGPGYFIDTSDACPSIQFSNVYPTEVVGTPITLQATTSGLPQATITSVNFYDNGVLIGTQTSGSGSGNAITYSQSWSPATGSHTIKAEAIGNGCGVGSKNSKSITVTH